MEDIAKKTNEKKKEDDRGGAHSRADAEGTRYRNRLMKGLGYSASGSGGVSEGFVWGTY